MKPRILAIVCLSLALIVFSISCGGKKSVGGDNNGPIITNHTPTWQTVPSNITITAGSIYNQYDGEAIDEVDTRQSLACSKSATSCGFAVSASGSGSNPQNCTINFTAPATAQTCNLRVMATDNGSPPLSVGQTISITVNSNAVIWTTTPSNITITAGSVYNQTNGVAMSSNAGQTLTCSNNGASCGFGVTVSGSGANPQSCNVNFTAPASPQRCSLRIMASNNGLPAATVGQTISIAVNTASNHFPTWSEAPSNIKIRVGSTYNQTNGVATDVDAGLTLACSSNGASCGFGVTVSGSGANPQNCNVSFTAPSSQQTCNLRVQAANNGSPSLTVGQTISITITAPKQWTIMVYMDGDNDLEEYAIANFNAMEKGLADAIAGGNTDIQDNLNVIVIFDRIPGYDSNPTEQGGSNWTDTRLYRVLPDSTADAYFRSERLDDGGAGAGHIANLGEQDMGDPAVLSWFISYCKTNFAANNYALILWDHGGGTRASGDTRKSSVKEVAYDFTSNYDVLYLDEVQQALEANFDSSHKLSILGYDACLMGMVEVAYEFRNLAEFMVAPMHTEQAYGWDYDYLFKNMTGSRDESVITAKDFSILMVEQYKNFIETEFHTYSGETMAATDLSQISSLATNIHALAVQIDVANKQTAIQTVRDASVHFYEDDYESVLWPFYDLYDFCNRIYTDSTNGFPTDLKNAAYSVITQLSNTIVYSYGEEGNGQSYYYGPGSSTMRGLSIFFSRGNLLYNGYTHYSYQWWYTDVDTNALSPGQYYGLIDFCTSNGNGVVEYWRELFEKWYDPSNIYTPSTY